MEQRSAFFTICIGVATTVSAWASEPLVTSRVGQSALGFFEAHSASTIDEFLASLRPAAIDALTLAKILAAVPNEGERRVKRPEPAELTKIAAARPIVQYHGRVDALAFKVIGGGAVVGLHRRSVVVASRRALGLLSPEEFAALVAHEIGHDFTWDEYLTAMRREDHGRMQELELRCDGIAVLTLGRLNIDPERLVSAVQKLTQENRQPRSMTRAADYPPLEERIAFIRAIAQMPWRELSGRSEVLSFPPKLQHPPGSSDVELMTSLGGSPPTDLTPRAQ